MQDVFNQFANMILDPTGAEQLMRQHREQAGVLPIPPEPSMIEPEFPRQEPIVVPPGDITLPEPSLPRSREPSVARSIISSVSLPVGVFPPSITASPQGMLCVIYTCLMLCDLMDLLCSQYEIYLVSPKIPSSSEEASVPARKSKLTEFFKRIFDEQMGIKRMEGEEEKIELEEMLIRQTEQNVGRGEIVEITKRDMALGFLQTLILKHNEDIEVEQNGWFQPIYLLNVE